MTSPFRLEAHMLPALRPHLGVFAATADWFTEVAAPNGIPDVVGVRFDAGELARRDRHGLVMPDARGCAAAALALTAAPEATPEEVAQRAALSVAVLRRRVLPSLADAGWVRPAGGGRWEMVEAYHDPAVELVVVELKLSAWRDALTQAHIGCSSADAAWVVLAAPASAAHAQVEHFERRGVGLAVLDESNLDVVVRPAGPSPQPAKRAVLAERILAMRRAGQSDGPDRHVFGRHLRPPPPNPSGPERYR